MFVFAFSSNVKAEGKNVLEVVSRLVLRLGGCEVVLQEGLQVLEGGPLLRVFLPALQHELVQRDGAVLGAGHPVASIHLFQHLAVVHAWKAQRGWGGAGKPSKRKQAGAARHDHAYLASIPPSVICHVQQMAREKSHRGKLDIKSDKGAPRAAWRPEIERQKPKCRPRPRTLTRVRHSALGRQLRQQDAK